MGLDDKKSSGGIWKSKEFLAGSGAAAFGMVLLLLTLIQPMALENTYAISENTVQIGRQSLTLENIDSSLVKLNENFDILDHKIDKMGLILCDISDGTYCNCYILEIKQIL